MIVDLPDAGSPVIHTANAGHMVHPPQYSLTREGSNLGLSSTARTKFSSFVRTLRSQLRIPEGFATTRPRKAKKGPTTACSSSSPVAFR